MTMPGVEAAVAHAVAVGAEVWVPLERVTDEDATREDVSASYARGVVKRVDESADAIDVEDGLGRRMRAKASAALPGCWGNASAAGGPRAARRLGR